MTTGVFSSRERPRMPGAAIEFVAGDVRPVHAAMVTAAARKNIWLVGGGGLVGQFADHGLLDEIILGVAPVTLGAGAPLLPRRLTTPPLRLIEAKVVDGTSPCSGTRWVVPWSVAPDYLRPGSTQPLSAGSAPADRPR